MKAATAMENATKVGSHSRTLRRKTLDAQTSRDVLLRYGNGIVRADRKMIHEYIKDSLTKMTENDFLRILW